MFKRLRERLEGYFEVAGDWLIIAFGVILLIHFSLFWIYGGVWIFESNKIVRGIETAMAVLIIAFGFNRWRGHMQKRKQAKGGASN